MDHVICSSKELAAELAIIESRSSSNEGLAELGEARVGLDVVREEGRLVPRVQLHPLAQGGRLWGHGWSGETQSE